jgi:hypothetical protein
MFTDRTLTGGPGLNRKVKEATADLALAFLDYTQDDAAGLNRWNLAWQDILAQAPAVTAARVAVEPGRDFRRTTLERPVAAAN